MTQDAFPGGPEAEAASRRTSPPEQPAGPGAQVTLTVTPRGKGTLEARDRRPRPPPPPSPHLPTGSSLCFSCKRHFIYLFT